MPPAIIPAISPVLPQVHLTFQPVGDQTGNNLEEIIVLHVFQALPLGSENIFNCLQSFICFVWHDCFVSHNHAKSKIIHDFFQVFFLHVSLAKLFRLLWF